MDLQVFLDIFQDLLQSAPRMCTPSGLNENCPYTYELAYSKNCYQIFIGGWVEDSYYNEFIIKCRDCVDGLKIIGCESCYECVDCENCYNSNFLVNCKNTRDSEFCYGLQDKNEKMT